MAMPPSQEEFDALRQKAQAQVDGFVDGAQRHGALSVEGRVLDEEVRAALLAQSRYADLLVASQRGQADVATPWSAATSLPTYLALHTGRPVLAVPPSYAGEALSDRIAIGWDGSLHAMRAITFALPLLQRARAVSLLIVNPNPVLGMEGDEPGADMALYLARHGVSVEVVVHRDGHSAAEVLLPLARDRSCALMVAGAYGHTRFREVVLGGVTGALLTDAPMPVFFAH